MRCAGRRRRQSCYALCVSSCHAHRRNSYIHLYMRPFNTRRNSLSTSIFAVETWTKLISYVQGRVEHTEKTRLDCAHNSYIRLGLRRRIHIQMKVNILAVSVLTDVSAAALSARPIKNVEGGIMMRALQTNQACEDEGMALGLCLGTYEDAFEDAEACAYCPLNAVVTSGIDTCSSSDVAGFCALVESCGVAECHTHCLDELQAGADCILREVGCDTCLVASGGSSPADGTTATPASSYPGVGNASSGGVGSMVSLASHLFPSFTASGSCETLRRIQRVFKIICVTYLRSEPINL